MEPKQVGQGRLIAGLGGLMLFAFLFLPWFSADSVNQSGWEGQSSTDIYMLITAMVAVAAALPGTRAMLVPGVTMSGAATLLGGVATVLLIWLSFIDVPSGEGREVGIYLALVAALVITVGAFMSSSARPAPARARRVGALARLGWARERAAPRRRRRPRRGRRSARCRRRTCARD